MAVAGRLAAIMTFGGFRSLWLGTDTTTPNDSLRMRDSKGTTECIAGMQIQVTDSAIRETIRTGLFRVTGEEATWSHQTYREYLAAWYIHKRDFKLTTITNLFMQRHYGKEKIAPPLVQIACGSQLLTCSSEAA